MPHSLISPKVRLSVSTLPFYLISEENWPYFIHPYTMNLEMSLPHSLHHVPIPNTNVFSTELCFPKHLSTSVFPFLPPPIMSPSLTIFCCLGNCYFLIFSCSPAPLFVFFGLLSKSVSVLACAFLLPSHLHKPLMSCVCKNHSQHIHSVWFPSLWLFNLEEAT